MSIFEKAAITVNGQTVSFGEIFKWVRYKGTFPALQEKLEQTLILQGAAEMGLVPGVVDLQEAADQIRREHNLYSSSDTAAWLKARGLTLDDLEALAGLRFMAGKIRERLADGNVEHYFNENRRSFDRAVISQIVTAEEGMARELLAQIKEEGVSFYALAQEYSTDRVTGDLNGLVGRVDRRSLSPQVEAVLFSAESGDVVGPVKTDQGYHLIKIEKMEPAQLDPVTTERIKDLLFREWLAQAMKKATITYDIWNEG